MLCTPRSVRVLARHVRRLNRLASGTGWEHRLLGQLPALWMAATLFVLCFVLWTPASGSRLELARFMALGIGLAFALGALVVCLACVSVLVLKGPAYLRDRSPSDTER